MALLVGSEESTGERDRDLLLRPSSKKNKEELSFFLQRIPFEKNVPLRRSYGRELGVGEGQRSLNCGSFCPESSQKSQAREISAKLVEESGPTLRARMESRIEEDEVKME